jgi:DNA-directed RNA polymerase specialized sigma24 family protein
VTALIKSRHAIRAMYSREKPDAVVLSTFVCSLMRMAQNVPEELSRIHEGLHKTIETIYRSESGRILATLARLLGDLDLAEEAMHEAFDAALDTWPETGIPDNPRPWLISTARFKAISGMRRRSRCVKFAA